MGMRSKNIASVIYTHVIVYGPVDGTNQSNFNLHILQMQKQVGPGCTQRNFFLWCEIGQGEREREGKNERGKRYNFPEMFRHFQLCSEILRSRNIKVT